MPEATLENINNKQESTITILTDHAISSLMENLKQQMADERAALVHGEIFVTLDSDPESPVHIEIGCSKIQFENDLKNMLKDTLRLRYQKNRIDATSNVIGLRRTVWFSEKDQEGVPYDERKTLPGGGTQEVVLL